MGAQPIHEIARKKLRPLYEGSGGPSLNFLMDLIAKPTTRAWYWEDHAEAVASAWFTHVGDEAELIDIRVAENKRRMGLAVGLLRFALEALMGNGLAVCRLEVRQSNQAARKLYESLGFEVTGRRPNYYRVQEGREDAILMAVDIKAIPKL
ncbi:MAG: GNAT family N-acetyltransferase [Luminiphilus sp.]|nr:GNAT family N-acetyltransferase [Luminiphilus sp.]